MPHDTSITLSLPAWITLFVAALNLGVMFGSARRLREDISTLRTELWDAIKELREDVKDLLKARE